MKRNLEISVEFGTEEAQDIEEEGVERYWPSGGEMFYSRTATIK